MTHFSLGVDRDDVRRCGATVAMSMAPADVEAEDLAAVAASGVVLVCWGCGDAEAELKCECCGDHLCHECWGEGDPFCEGCMGEGSDERPVENVQVQGGVL